MKIGLVSPYPFKFPGGVNEHIKGLYTFLKSKGHDVKILAPRHNQKENYGKDFLLFGRDVPFPFNASTSYASFELNMRKLKHTLEKEDFDILHFHDIGIFLPLQILNLSKSKNILTFHSLPDASLIYKVSSDILKWAEKPVSDNFSSLIATSKPVSKIVNKIYKGPTYIIPNAIDLEKFNPKVKKIKKFLDGKINILFVGRFDKRKGLDYLLDAFHDLKKINNIRLIVVGSGDNREYYEKFVKEKNIEDVVFVGYVPDKELPKYYSTCDIFCSPATHGEGFGIVLLESMSTGKPIVAFANAGYKHVINGYAKKFLVKPHDTEQLTKKLDILIKNEKLRSKLGKWGLKEVEKYSWDKVGNEILKVYEMVLNEK